MCSVLSEELQDLHSYHLYGSHEAEGAAQSPNRQFGTASPLPGAIRNQCLAPWIRCRRRCLNHAI